MKKIITQISLTLMLSVSMLNNAFAQTADEAVATVKTQVSTLLADLKTNKSHYQKAPSNLNNMIESKMDEYFDADVMARLVMGKHWKNATKQQKKDFIQEFKQMILRTYSSSLLDYTDAKVDYGKAEKVKRNRTKIDATVTSPTGKIYPLTLSMIYRNGKWKAYDVSMDGLSVITSYRSSIGEEISQKGLQAVIDEIRQLNLRGEAKKS